MGKIETGQRGLERKVREEERKNCVCVCVVYIQPEGPWHSREMGQKVEGPK